MNAHYQELLEAVSRRLEVVADRGHYERDPTGHLQELMRASAALDEKVKALPANTDPQLRHFLERQSYLKAVDWLKAALAEG